MILRMKLVSVLLCFSIFFASSAPNAAAWWTAAPNIAPELPTAVATTGTVATTGATAGSSLIGTGGILTDIGMTLSKFAKDNLASIAFVGIKLAALKVVQMATAKIIGSGGGGKTGSTVTDWNNYLYTSPQQRAMAQMDSFFNTVSKGKLSALNYEGVNGKATQESYLVKESKRAIAGQQMRTTLPEYATDLNDITASGNMKGMLVTMQCGNNVACYTMVSQSKYATEMEKAKTIADKKQKDGILPIEVNGKITKPAAIVASAMSGFDQQGEKLIMDAKAATWEEYSGALTQVATGAAISLAARTLSYAAADEKGKAAIQNKNDSRSYPFSVSYSTTSGLGYSAAGTKSNTGMGVIDTKKITTQLQTTVKNAVK